MKFDSVETYFNEIAGLQPQIEAHVLTERLALVSTEIQAWRSCIGGYHCADIFVSAVFSQNCHSYFRT